MDYINAFLLLILGFAVGLSGALMPGPLFVYTVQEALKKGKWVGFLAIIGHSIVEVVIFILLMLGLQEAMTSQLFIRAASVLGGLALILFGVHSLRGIRKHEIPQNVKTITQNTVIGGIIFTAFNPGFPIWWATAGTRLLLEGLQRMGYAGMLLVFLGHWIADFGWFTLVSMITAKSSRLLFEKGWYKKIRITLAITMMAIGVYFLTALG